MMLNQIERHQGSGVHLPNLPNSLTQQISPVKKHMISKTLHGSPDRSNSPRDRISGSPLGLDVHMDPTMMTQPVKGPGHMRNMSQKIRANALKEVNDLSKSVSIPRSYKVSIQDMVNSSKKVNDEFGIDNYENPYLKYNPHTQKSMNYSISKDMIPRDSISML